jgi:nitroimidazol reductase NimA-like FMN-containing flavoprotein (pyridoxamine 5'-phosphate oxidase superfamily)
MLIHELTRQASLEVLARTDFGRLACAQGIQPYIVPFHFAYQNYCLYSFSMPGQKIDWMRANPLVCVEADHMVSSEQWTSVVVFGRYEELPDTTETQGERALAFKLLQRRAFWWEPGSIKIMHDGTPPALVPIFYRINVVQITGRRATSEPGAPDTKRSTADSAKTGWLHKILRRVRRT